MRLIFQADVSTADVISKQYKIIDGAVALDGNNAKIEATYTPDAWLFVTKRSFYLRYLSTRGTMMTVELGLNLGKYIWKEGKGLFVDVQFGRRDNSRYTRHLENEYDFEESYLVSAKNINKKEEIGPSEYETLDWEIEDKLQFLGLYKPVFHENGELGLSRSQVQLVNAIEIYEAKLKLGIAK